MNVDLLVFAGALAGGLVSGLTGFGTGLTALPIWIQVLSPALASPLVVVCSLVGQVQTLPAIWHAMDFRRLLPFVAGGIPGIPVGVLLLPHVPVIAFKAGLGVLLVATCVFLLANRSRAEVRWGARAADFVIGFVGGVLGGLAGLSGIVPTIWAELRGWPKDARRAVIQGYNFCILALALASQGAAGLLTAELAKLLLVALPGTILGALIGRWIYARLDTRGFSKVVLVVLLAAGVGLIVAG